MKLRPVDMATEGLFICGTAHSPQLLNESIAQADAAAARAVTFLSQSRLTLSAVTARVTRSCAPPASSACGPAPTTCRGSTRRA